jgi:hypothetical protein
VRRTILWVVGEPGIGKTTFVRSLLVDPKRWLVEKPKWTLSHGGRLALAGHYTGDKFDGADRVPYNGVAAALDFWKERLKQAAELTVFDGDRFSNKGVVNWFAMWGASAGIADLKCLHLVGADGVAEARRTGRLSHQDVSWVKGRKTKSLRFAQGFSAPVMWTVNDPRETLDTAAVLRSLDLSWVLSAPFAPPA